MRSMLTRWLVGGGCLLAASVLVWTVMQPNESGAAASRTRPPELAFEVGGTSDCEHPLLPRRVGTQLTYRVRVEDGSGTEAIQRIRLREVAPEGTGWTLRWDLALGEEPWGELEERNALSTMETSCWRAGAQPHWLLFPAHEVNRWTWPAEMAPGVEFSGQLSFEMSHGIQIEMERAHRVGPTEAIEVAGRNWDATRVSFTGRGGPVGSEPEEQHGTLWVAQEVGLVRSETHGDASPTRVMELIEVRLPESPTK